MMTYHRQLLHLLASRWSKGRALVRLATGVRTVALRVGRDGRARLPPISIGIALTYRCNLRCVECSQWGRRGWIKDRERSLLEDELGTEELCRFISEVAPFRPYLQLTGGEPLLRQDVFDVIEHASSRGLLTGLTTNGTLLEAGAERLVRSGLEYLYVSLDAPGEANDAIRVGRFSSSRTVAGVRAVLRERERQRTGLPLVEVRMTVIAENHERIVEMAEFVEEELRPDVFCVMPVFFVTEAALRETRELFLRELELDPVTLRGELFDPSGIDPATFARQVAEVERRRWRFKLRLCEPLGKNGFSYHDYLRRPDRVLCGLTRCGALYTFTLLEPNGNVVTCASKPDYVAGNIRESRFDEIWFGERYRRFRARAGQGLFPSCSRCRHIYKFSHY